MLSPEVLARVPQGPTGHDDPARCRVALVVPELFADGFIRDFINRFDTYEATGKPDEMYLPTPDAH